MNNDKHVADLERMAREAGAWPADILPNSGLDQSIQGRARIDALARFAALVRADALEQAAETCMALTRTYWNDTSDEDRDYPDANECAAAIRALSAPQTPLTMRQAEG